MFSFTPGFKLSFIYKHNACPISEHQRQSPRMSKDQNEHIVTFLHQTLHRSHVVFQILSLSRWASLLAPTLIIQTSHIHMQLHLITKVILLEHVKMNIDHPQDLNLDPK
jgi:hypothetical protein